MLYRFLLFIIGFMATVTVANEPMVISDQSAWSKRVEALVSATLASLPSKGKSVSKVYILQNATLIPQTETDCLAISAVGSSLCKFQFYTRPEAAFMEQLYKAKLPGKRIGIIHDSQSPSLIKGEVELPFDENTNLVREAAYKARKDFDVLVLDHYLFSYTVTDISLLLEMSYRKSVPVISFLPIESKGALFSIDAEKYLPEEFSFFISSPVKKYSVKKVVLNVNSKLNVLYSTNLPDHTVFEVVK